VRKVLGRHVNPVASGSARGGSVLSVVVPCFNEEGRLGHTLERIRDHLGRAKTDHEIIVVDDGSTDRTREVALSFPAVRLTPIRGNRGKGYSVREGMLLARGDPVLMTDADLSTPIEELDRFLRLIETADVVIASRALPGAAVQTVWYRKLLGRLGHLIIASVTVRGLKDTQCGFKLFRREAVRQIFPKQTLEGFGFDFEVLFLAQRDGLRIREEPVRWMNDPLTKVRWHDYLKTLSELLRVVWNRLRGAYGPARAA
jgi:dolichyl-phosphate beta-glucosyltransferase